MMSRHLVREAALDRACRVLLLAALLVSPRCARAADHTETISLSGESVAVDFYLPAATEPAPILVVAHGFARSRQNVGPWGVALAARGYVVAVPGFPGLLPDHAKNGRVVSALLQWMDDQGAGGHAVLGGRVEGSLRGVLGHSAGGLACILAAASDPSIDVVVGLDLVDGRSNEGLAVAGSVDAAVALLMAEPDQCNSDDNGSALYDALPGPRLHLRVSGADHCDPESPTSNCNVLLAQCGVADPAVHEIYRRYAFAALDHVLACDEEAATWLGGTGAVNDAAIEDLRVEGFPLEGCAGGEPGDGEPGDGEPGDGEPGDGEPGDGEPGDGEPGDGEPGDGEPGADDDAPVSCGCFMKGRSLGSPSAFFLVGLLAVLGLLRPRRGA